MPWAELYEQMRREGLLDKVAGFVRRSRPRRGRDLSFLPFWEGDLFGGHRIATQRMAEQDDYFELARGDAATLGVRNR